MNHQLNQNGMNYLRLGDLPGFSRFYVDYAECIQSALKFFPCCPDIESLVVHAKLPREGVHSTEDVFQNLQPLAYSETSLANFRRLQDPKTRIIWVTQPVSLFGGSFGQILKCLTAIKLAEEMTQRGVPTIPVCEVGPGFHIIKDQFTLTLLDYEGKLQQLDLRDSAMVVQKADGDYLIPAQIEEFFAILDSMVSNLWGCVVLDLLKEIYRTGAPLSSASEQLMIRLFADQGLVVLNFHQGGLPNFLRRESSRLGLAPEQVMDEIRRKRRDMAEAGYEILDDRYSCMIRENPLILPFLRHSALPVAAVIAEPGEMELMGLIRPVYDKLGLIPPAVWPRASASLISGKVQQTLDRYHINLPDAFAGKRAMLGKSSFDSGLTQTKDQFRGLSERIKEKVDTLIILAGADDRLRNFVGSAGEKMIYQVNKLQERLGSSLQAQRAAFERRLERLINNMVPYGLLQEEGFSAVHFLFQYSPALIQNIKRRLDILRHRHQLIFMD